VRCLLDTNIYFHILQDPAYLARYRAALLRVTPQTFLSSVVRFELVRGARGDIARARVAKAVEPLERVGRVIAPTHSDWAQAGTIQGRIWDDHPSLRTKTLQNDLLIVYTARRVGAIVITGNMADFDLIRPYVPHRALSMQELARRLGA
jgi:predicted nucleic acid-binding protein